jgi:hypothetical protein
MRYIVQTYQKSKPDGMEALGACTQIGTKWVNNGEAASTPNAPCSSGPNNE